MNTAGAFPQDNQPFKDINEGLQSAGEYAKQKANDAINYTASIGDQVANNLVERFSQIKDVVARNFNSAKETLDEELVTVFENIPQINAKEIGSNLAVLVKDGVVNSFNDLKDLFVGLGEKFEDEFLSILVDPKLTPGQRLLEGSAKMFSVSLDTVFAPLKIISSVSSIGGKLAGRTLEQIQNNVYSLTGISFGRLWTQLNGRSLALAIERHLLPFWGKGMASGDYALQSILKFLTNKDGEIEESKMQLIVKVSEFIKNAKLSLKDTASITELASLMQKDPESLNALIEIFLRDSNDSKSIKEAFEKAGIKNGPNAFLQICLNAKQKAEESGEPVEKLIIDYVNGVQEYNNLGTQTKGIIDALFTNNRGAANDVLLQLQKLFPDNTEIQDLSIRLGIGEKLSDSDKVILMNFLAQGIKLSQEKKDDALVLILGGVMGKEGLSLENAAAAGARLAITLQMAPMLFSAAAGPALAKAGILIDGSQAYSFLMSAETIRNSTQHFEKIRQEYKNATSYTQLAMSLGSVAGSFAIIKLLRSLDIEFKADLGREIGLPLTDVNLQQSSIVDISTSAIVNTLVREITQNTKGAINNKYIDKFLSLWSLGSGLSFLHSSVETLQQGAQNYANFVNKEDQNTSIPIDINGDEKIDARNIKPLDLNSDGKADAYEFRAKGSDFNGDGEEDILVFVKQGDNGEGTVFVLGEDEKLHPLMEITAEKIGLTQVIEEEGKILEVTTEVKTKDVLDEQIDKQDYKAPGLAKPLGLYTNLAGSVGASLPGTPAALPPLPLGLGGDDEWNGGFSWDEVNDDKDIAAVSGSNPNLISTIDLLLNENEDSRDEVIKNLVDELIDNRKDGEFYAKDMDRYTHPKFVEFIEKGDQQGARNWLREHDNALNQLVANKLKDEASGDLDIVYNGLVLGIDDGEIKVVGVIKDTPAAYRDSIGTFEKVKNKDDGNGLDDVVSLAQDIALGGAQRVVESGLEIGRDKINNASEDIIREVSVLGLEANQTINNLEKFAESSLEVGKDKTENSSESLVANAVKEVVRTTTSGFRAVDNLNAVLNGIIETGKNETDNKIDTLITNTIGEVVNKTSKLILSVESLTFATDGILQSSQNEIDSRINNVISDKVGEVVQIASDWVKSVENLNIVTEGILKAGKNETNYKIINSIAEAVGEVANTVSEINRTVNSLSAVAQGILEVGKDKINDLTSGLALGASTKSIKNKQSGNVTVEAIDNSVNPTPTPLTSLPTKVPGTETPEEIDTDEPSPTASVEPSATNIEEPTDEPEAETPVASGTPIPTNTDSSTLTQTQTPTDTISPTFTSTPTETPTPEPSDTSTATSTVTPTPEPTGTPTTTNAASPTFTSTPEPTNILAPTTASLPGVSLNDLSGLNYEYVDLDGDGIISNNDKRMLYGIDYYIVKDSSGEDRLVDSSRVENGDLKTLTEEDIENSQKLFSVEVTNLGPIVKLTGDKFIREGGVYLAPERLRTLDQNSEERLLDPETNELYYIDGLYIGKLLQEDIKLTYNEYDNKASDSYGNEYRKGEPKSFNSNEDELVLISAKNDNFAYVVKGGGSVSVRIKIGDEVYRYTGHQGEVASDINLEEIPLNGEAKIVEGQLVYAGKIFEITKGSNGDNSIALISETPTSTSTNTSEPSATTTVTPTPERSATLTNTPTNTASPTATPTNTSTATSTPEPSATTATEELDTETPEPSETTTATQTNTTTATSTPEPSATPTATPTETSTLTPSSTATNTLEPSSEVTASSTTVAVQEQNATEVAEVVHPLSSATFFNFNSEEDPSNPEINMDDTIFFNGSNYVLVNTEHGAELIEVKNDGEINTLMQGDYIDGRKVIDVDINQDGEEVNITLEDGEVIVEKFETDNSSSEDDASSSISATYLATNDDHVMIVNDEEKHGGKVDILEDLDKLNTSGPMNIVDTQATIIAKAQELGIKIPENFFENFEYVVGEGVDEALQFRGGSSGSTGFERDENGRLHVRYIYVDEKDLEEFGNELTYNLWVVEENAQAVAYQAILNQYYSNPEYFEQVYGIKNDVELIQSLTESLAPKGNFRVLGEIMQTYIMDKAGFNLSDISYDFAISSQGNELRYSPEQYETRILEPLRGLIQENTGIAINSNEDLMTILFGGEVNGVKFEDININIAAPLGMGRGSKVNIQPSDEVHPVNIYNLETNNTTSIEEEIDLQNSQQLESEEPLTIVEADVSTSIEQNRGKGIGIALQDFPNENIDKTGIFSGNTENSFSIDFDSSPQKANNGIEIYPILDNEDRIVVHPQLGQLYSQTNWNFGINSQNFEPVFDIDGNIVGVIGDDSYSKGNNSFPGLSIFDNLNYKTASDGTSYLRTSFNYGGQERIIDIVEEKDERLNIARIHYNNPDNIRLAYTYGSAEIFDKVFEQQEVEPSNDAQKQEIELMREGNNVYINIDENSSKELIESNRLTREYGNLQEKTPLVAEASYTVYGPSSNASRVLEINAQDIKFKLNRGELTEETLSDEQKTILEVYNKYIEEDLDDRFKNVANDDAEFGRAFYEEVLKPLGYDGVIATKVGEDLGRVGYIQLWDPVKEQWVGEFRILVLDSSKEEDFINTEKETRINNFNETNVQMRWMFEISREVLEKAGIPTDSNKVGFIRWVEDDIHEVYEVDFPNYNRDIKPLHNENAEWLISGIKSVFTTSNLNLDNLPSLFKYNVNGVEHNSNLNEDTFLTYVFNQAGINVHQTVEPIVNAIDTEGAAVGFPKGMLEQWRFFNRLNEAGQMNRIIYAGNQTNSGLFDNDWGVFFIEEVTTNIGGDAKPLSNGIVRRDAEGNVQFVVYRDGQAQYLSENQILELVGDNQRLVFFTE